MKVYLINWYIKVGNSVYVLIHIEQFTNLPYLYNEICRWIIAIQNLVSIRTSKSYEIDNIYESLDYPRIVMTAKPVK